MTLVSYYLKDDDAEDDNGEGDGENDDRKATN